MSRRFFTPDYYNALSDGEQLRINAYIMNFFAENPDHFVENVQTAVALLAEEDHTLSNPSQAFQYLLDDIRNRYAYNMTRDHDGGLPPLQSNDVPRDAAAIRESLLHIRRDMAQDAVEEGYTPSEHYAEIAGNYFARRDGLRVQGELLGHASTANDFVESELGVFDVKPYDARMWESFQALSNAGYGTTKAAENAAKQIETGLSDGVEDLIIEAASREFEYSALSDEWRAGSVFEDEINNLHMSDAITKVREMLDTAGIEVTADTNPNPHVDSSYVVTQLVNAAKDVAAGRE